MASPNANKPIVLTGGKAESASSGEVGAAAPESSAPVGVSDSTRLDRLEGMIAALMGSVQAKDAEIISLRQQVNQATTSTETIHERMLKKTQDWEKMHEARLQKLEDDLAAGQQRYELSLPNEPRMTRIVGGVDASHARGKYETYFNRRGGPSPMVKEMGQGVG